MTRYTVVWHETAQDKLAAIRLRAQDRAAVSTAANTVDRELGEDASAKGSHVVANSYEFTVLPLRVLYQVSELDRLVKVAGVKRVRR